VRWRCPYSSEMYSGNKQIMTSFSALVRNDGEEREKKLTCVHLGEVIIAIGTVKTMLKFRVGR